MTAINKAQMNVLLRIWRRRRKEQEGFEAGEQKAAGFPLKLRLCNQSPSHGRACNSARASAQPSRRDAAFIVL